MLAALTVLFCAVSFLGMFSFSLLAMLPFTNAAFSKVCGDYYNEMTSLSVLSSIIGGSLMGLGMTISGSVVHYYVMQCFTSFHLFHELK